MLILSFAISSLFSTTSFAAAEMLESEDIEIQSVNEDNTYKIGDVLDYEIYIAGENSELEVINDKEAHDEFMKERGMVPGAVVQFGNYIYEITDNYQLEIIELAESTSSEILNNLTRGDDKPTIKGSLPYSRGYNFANNVPFYTSRYFNVNAEEVVFTMSYDRGYSTKTITVNAIDMRNDESMQSARFKLPSGQVTGAYFWIYPNENFYFSVEKDEGGTVTGNIDIDYAR